MKIRLLSYLILGLFILVISSCEFEDIPVETDTFGIRHDVDLEEYEDLGQNAGQYSAEFGYPDFSSVCALTYMRDGDPIDASGVLINPEWVMTAAHNLVSGNEDFPDPQATDMVISFGFDLANPEMTIDVTEAYLHPGWIPNQGEGREAAVDIALLKLKQPVYDFPFTTYASEMNEMLGGKLYVCGYGDYSEVTQSDMFYSQRHAFENILDRLTKEIMLDYSYSGDEMYLGGMMGCDFDSPIENTNALNEESINSSNVEVRALGAGTSSSDALELEGTTVPGDSGGPAFLKINGIWQVIGIVSSGSTDSNYGDVAIFTRVSSHAEWIRSIIQ